MDTTDKVDDRHAPVKWVERLRRRGTWPAKLLAAAIHYSIVLPMRSLALYRLQRICAKYVAEASNEEHREMRRRQVIALLDKEK